MRKRMTVLALLLCLLLTACGGEEADSGGQASFLEETFGLEEGAILLTVDGKEIPAFLSNCLARSHKDRGRVCHYCR